MLFHSWRGTIGVIKPTYRPGSLEDFIRLLPEGIGVIPLYLGVKRGSTEEFRSAMDVIRQKVRELAEIGVDMIHPEGAPPFMIHGYDGEAQIVADMEKEHGLPVYTSGMTQVEALRALGVKKMLGVTYFDDSQNIKYAKYFEQAGFDVAAMNGIDVPFADIGRVSPNDIYAFIKQEFLKVPDVDGIYLLGTGWHVLDRIEMLEQDLGLPVVHPIPARIWATQRRLMVREKRTGYGCLLEQLPEYNE